MNHLNPLVGLLFVTVCGIPNVVKAQPILMGCTTGTSSTHSFLVDLDLGTGLALNPRDIGIKFVGGIAVQPGSGTLFGLTASVSAPPNSLVRLNADSGTYTLVGSTGLPLIVEGDLAFNPQNGLLYGLQDGGISATQRNFFRIDASTGSATIIANLPSPAADFSGLAFNSAGALFVIDSAGSSNSLLQAVDPVTGAITSTVTMNVNLGSAVGFAFHPSTGIAYVSDGDPFGTSTGFLYTLDTSTGILTPIGPTGIPVGIAGLAFVPVPEPSSLILAGFGLAAFFRRSNPQSSSQRKT